MIAGIIGTLGQGKTATLAYLATHFYNQDKNIYANFILTKINFKSVLTIGDIDAIREGYFCADELWSWMDARTSSDEYNMQISKILLSSRKRGYNLIYTSQGLYQMDKRIRLITNYVLVPEILYVDPETRNTYPIEQSFLYPYDYKDDIKNMAVFVDVCVIQNEIDLKKVDEFSFWLSDVVNGYDTAQEIHDIKNTTGKGIFIENKFKEEVQRVLEQELIDKKVIIIQPAYSGKNLETLDLEVRINGKLHIFDVTTIQKRQTKGFYYEYINQGKKVIPKTIKMLESRGAYGYYAFSLMNIWYVTPIIEDMRYNILTNIKTLKQIETAEVFFKRMMNNEEWNAPEVTQEDTDPKSK